MGMPKTWGCIYHCNTGPTTQRSGGGNAVVADLVLIQPFLLSYVHHVVLMPNSILKHNFHKKRKEVCIKTRSTSASLSLKG